MYILAIETTGPHCSVAIIDENKNIIMKKSEDRLNHLKLLTPMIDEILKENNIEMKDLDAVAVSKGPGSFTGIRIGVSTARAFGQVLDIPCIGVPTLYAFAQSKKADEGMVCPVFDARRSQVYACGCIGAEEVVQGKAYGLSEFLEEVKNQAQKNNVDKLIFMGDGIKPYGQEIEEFCKSEGFSCEAEETYQYADGVAEVALLYFNLGKTVDFNNLEPEYMRKAEAQRKLEERLKG